MEPFGLALLNSDIRTGMAFAYGGEDPAILQLQKWGSSQVQLNLSDFCEGFISPRRELLLLLSYHCEALLLPLGNKRSKDPQSSKNFQNQDALFSCSLERTVPGKTELGDDCESTSQSIETETCNIKTQTVDFTGSNSFPSISDVSTVAWGMCEDLCCPHDSVPFKELLFVLGSEGVTVHAFCQSYMTSEFVTPTEQDVGQGLWVEWGPSTASAQPSGAVYDSTMQSDDSLDVSDLSWSSATGERANGCSMEGQKEVSSESFGVKRWLHTYLTKVETIKSDGTVYTKFPDKSSVPSSASVVSFRNFLSCQHLLEFLSDGCPISHDKQNGNISAEDHPDSISTDSTQMSPDALVDQMSSSYKCFRVFSNDAQCLIGFALNTKKDVQINSTNIDDGTGCKVLVAVARLINWGMQWVCSVTVGKCIEGRPAIEWPEFRFSHAFLICLNVSGLISLYIALTGEHIACLDLLNVCGVSPSLVSQEQKDSSLKIRESCIEEKKCGQLINQAGDFVGRRRFKRLLVISHSSTFCVIDEYGLTYVIHVDDHIPKKYCSLEKLHPQYQQLSDGMLAAWEVGAAEIGYQRVFSGFFGGKEQSRSSIIRESSFADNTHEERKHGSYGSSLSDALDVNKNKIFGSRSRSCHSRKVFLAIDGSKEDGVVCFSPFGITRLVKGKYSEGNGKYRLIHSSLDVNMTINDDSSYNIQGWDAIVDDAIGCSFHGCLYLVTKDGIAVVLPHLSLPSNFYPVEAIGYQQSCYSAGSKYELHKLQEFESTKRPLSPWKVEVLDKALLYEGPEVADQLCLENGWDLSVTWIRNLQLSLEYLKFEEIEKSLAMLAHVNLAEEGILRMLLAVVYLMSCKVGNDNEVSAASRLLALGTSFATKMIREYGLLQHKKYGMESWKAGGVQNSFLSSELIDSRPDRMGDLERLQKMAHFLEIIRNLQWRLTYKCKRLGQELVDQGEAVGETDLSQDESRILDLPADISSLEASNQKGLIPASEMERNNGEDLALMPVDAFDCKDISSLDTFKESSLISEEKRVFSIENPKDMIARWEIDNLDVKTVVKDAILSGRLPLAVLKLHLHRSRDLMSDQENQDTFNEVREVGRAIAYDLFLKGETGLAVATLQRLGEDIETSLKQLVFGTVRRSLRMQIVEVMKELAYLGPHEWKILERISLIERVYPCSSFWSTFSCRHKEFKGVSNGNSTEEIKLHLLAPLGRDLVIACGELDGVVLGSWMNVNEQPIAPEADDDSTHSSYWSAAAVWFDVWDQRVVDCIVLDQPFLMGVNVLWESQLDYHIRHSDWLDVSRLLEVIPSYALTSGSLSVSLDGIRSSSVDEYLQKPHDCGSYIYSLEEVDAVCMNVPSVQIFRFSAHSMCSMWLLMLMERELAKKFIFLKDYWGATADIVALLAQSGFIRDVHKSLQTDEPDESWSESVLAISDARTHPDSIQAFHKVIVQYCSHHNLLSFLDLYLDHHKLALDLESISWMQDAAGYNQWAKWLLLQRVKGKEYEASFSNARAVVSHNLVAGNSFSTMERDDIIHTVDDIAEGAGEMAALATLMYAPIPIQDCLSSGSVNRLYSSVQCTLENLRPFLQRFPTLYRALTAACFGQDPTCSSIGPKPKLFGYSDLLDYLNWRESVFFSSAHDTSLSQMLPCWFPKSVRRLIQLYVQGPLGWQSIADLPVDDPSLLRDIVPSNISPLSWEVAIQKHIEEELYDSSLKESKVGIEHHLHRGRALAAFNQLLSNRVQKLKSESSRRQHGTPVQGQTNIQSDVQILLSPITQSEQLFLSSVVPLAIVHFADSVLVASCALLLELCGLSPGTLQIDVAALRRIASFNKSGHCSNHLQQFSPRGSSFHSNTCDNNITESLARGLADDYCQNDWFNQANPKSDQFTTSDRQPSRALMLVLQHLETSSLPSSADGVTCGSWLLTGNGDGVELRSQQKASSEHWNLVTTFCQAHQLPVSTRYLALLARDNDWVGFLSEAQIGGYTLETVTEVALKEFGDARLKTHILTVLKSIQSRKKYSSSSSSDTGEKKNGTSFPDENVHAPADLFGIIAECERQARPGEALLLQAKNLCWSLLAAIASCFPDVCSLSCLTVWLEITAARETSAIKVNNAASQIANNVEAAVEATNSLPASAKTPTVHYNRKNPKRSRLMEPVSVHSLVFTMPDVQKVDGNVTIQDMTAEEECETQVDPDKKVSNDSDEVAGSLSRMVAVLCEQHLFLPLLRAFEMFLPSCSLLPFIRALQAFSQMRLSEASAHLGSFSARIKEEPHVYTQSGKEGKIGSLWISSTAVKAANAMLSRCPSPYEKRCLLHLLAATDFGDGGSAATCYQRLYWKVNLAEPSLRKNDGLHLGNEPLDDASLLRALEEHGHWEQARNWAKHLEASGGSWKSATHHVTETQAESMVAEWKEFLWDVPEERAALWGHCQTLFLRYSFPPLQAGLFFLKHAEAAERDLPARELHELLLLSLQWLSGMITLCSPVCPLHLLREIETRAWLLAVESETQVKSEGEFTLSSREPASGKGPNIIDRTASIITKMDNHINSVRIKSGERNDTRESNQSHLKTTQMSDSSSSGTILGSAKVKRRAKGFVPSRKSLADSVDRSDEPEIGSINFNMKEDSQLPNENLKIEATFSKWEERVGPAELERAVLSLLEFGQIAASRQLQHKLSPGCIPSEFKLADAALKLAVISTPNNKVSILVLDGELRSVMQSHNLFPNQHVIDPLQVLESFALLLTEGRGRGLCRRITSVVKAANMLGLPFSEAFEKHPIELLQLLSLKAQDSFEEAKLLVQSHYMPAASIAQILAESFLKGLLAAHRGGYMESQKEEGPAPLLWRFSDFLKWAELCPSEPEVGHALLRLVATCQGIPHACEVELLILSHHFYKSSSCLDGVDVLVDLAFKKVEAYVSEGDFSCLARLITGVGNFHALNFILGILIENGQLDLLLQKFSAAVDDNDGTAEEVRGFRMAVLTLLKQFNPNDHDAFAMVYSHFDMKHETASLLESRAQQSCKEWSLHSDKDQTDELLASMRYFIEAAEVYSSIDAGNKTRQGCAQASLLYLQIRMPDLHFIYLSETNARRALVEQSRFQEALIVAEAYGLNQPGEWALVLWNQMLRPELVEQFVAEFVAVFPLQPSMLLELARFYRAEVAARGDQSQFSVWLTGGGLPAEWAKYLGRSFRCLLRRTRDLRLRYQLATIATGFTDVVDACNRAFDKIPESAGPLVLRKGHGGGYLPLM
ncbi:hypothetical protein RND71_014718 [Anisodus tanguticus]|uniref:Spatacsin C-terminal domain-containing protein n=1 Tax=Anisodus tanguticus TaxID=243964 RepID=A0AAE1SA64_9SOLA|nr:hypothetical protein RND71_014718 [Anisodus tanguticus]